MPRQLSLFDHPHVIAFGSLLTPSIHGLLASFKWISLKQPQNGFADLVNATLTASGFLASMAGIVVVFLLSERGQVFRKVRETLGTTFRPQMVGLFALPATGMVLSISALLPLPGALTVLLLETAAGLLVISLVYEFCFLSLSITASATQDRDDKNQLKVADLHRKNMNST